MINLARYPLKIPLKPRRPETRLFAVPHSGFIRFRFPPERTATANPA